jgi:hypothetical protein
MGGLDGEYQSATKLLNTSNNLRNQTHTSKGSELGVQPETVIVLVLVVTSFFVTVIVFVNQNRLVVLVLCL